MELKLLAVVKLFDDGKSRFKEAATKLSRLAVVASCLADLAENFFFFDTADGSGRLIGDGSGLAVAVNVVKRF